MSSVIYVNVSIFVSFHMKCTLSNFFWSSPKASKNARLFYLSWNQPDFVGQFLEPYLCTHLNIETTASQVLSTVFFCLVFLRAFTSCKIDNLCYSWIDKASSLPFPVHITERGLESSRVAQEGGCTQFQYAPNQGVVYCYVRPIVLRECCCVALVVMSSEPRSRKTLTVSKFLLLLLLVMKQTTLKAAMMWTKILNETCGEL